jgi:WD40 repeat protein
MPRKRSQVGGLALLAALFLPMAGAQQPALPPINPAAARLDATVEGLDGPGFAIAGDERTGTVAAACDGGTIRYWHKDVVMGVRAGGRTPNVLRGHRGAVLALVWQCDACLASAGADGKVILWDLAAAKPKYTCSPGTIVRCLALSPDGKLLAGGGDDMLIHFWDTATGKPAPAESSPLRLKGHTDWVLCLAFNADGKLLASGGHDGTVRLWDVSAGKKIRDIDAQPPPAPNTAAGPAPSVSAVAFSPDDKQLAVGNMEAQIHLFNVTDGKFVRTLPGHTSTVTALAYHPDGAVLISASKDRTIRLWSPAGGQMLKALEGHTAWVEGVVLVGRGTRLASVGADRTVRFWDLTNPPPK